MHNTVITWRPDNVETVNTWKLAMVLSKGYERILIGSGQDIKQKLSREKEINLLYDETRQLGTLLIKFDDDCAEGKWRNALLLLKEAQEVTFPEKLRHLADQESRMIMLEKEAQMILREKYDTGDPICKYVAVRIWYGYWGIREKGNKDRIKSYFSCMENLIRPFYRKELLLKEDRRVLAEDPIFRWPAMIEDCDERMIIYNQRLKGTDSYIVADDSLIPLKQYYTDCLAKWRICLIQCKICGRFFIAGTLRNSYCSTTCRRIAEIKNKEKRMADESNRAVEKLCRNEYAYWDNRLRKAKKATSWTEEELYDLESAFIRFKELKVVMRKQYKKGKITFQELSLWFLYQRDIIDDIMKKHG